MQTGKSRGKPATTSIGDEVETREFARDFQLPESGLDRYAPGGTASRWGDITLDHTGDANRKKGTGTRPDNRLAGAESSTKGREPVPFFLVGERFDRDPL
jgi:hypothetical protein